MTHIRKSYADSKLGQIHYRYALPSVEDPAKLPILFLHMSASSSASFDALMELFAPLGYRCFAPDMPGFGMSFDPTKDPPNIAWYVERYHEAFGAMPAFKNGCHLVGHHSGGVIGIEFNIMYPKFIRSLTIEGPALLTAAERDEMRKTFLSPFNKPVKDGSHLLKTWNYLIETAGMPKEDIDLLQREGLNHIRAWKGRTQIYSCVWNHDGLDLFPKITCPTLCLCARDDVLWPYFHYVKKLKPDAETEEVEGGNFGPDRGTQSIAYSLKSFLAAV